jgi:hypothetical protein
MQRRKGISRKGAKKKNHAKTQREFHAKIKSRKDAKEFHAKIKSRKGEKKKNHVKYTNKKIIRDENLF